jgi:hypothetical protein
MPPRRNINDKRKKKISLNVVKAVLLLIAGGLWVLLAWSHYHIAKQQNPMRKPSSPASLVQAANTEAVAPIPTGSKPAGALQVTSGAASTSAKGQKYPPIDSIVTGKYNVSGDMSFLVDFAIIGFPKCGTSTMMEYLDQSPHTKVAQKEKCELGTGRQAKLVRDLYAEFPEGNFKRGIKCPRDLENEYAVGKYMEYLPNTNFLVGMRHPVRWFESFYNFRVYNKNPMPPPDQLVGVCGKYSRHVCTHRARYHQFLANLGKTPLTEPEKKSFKQGGRELRVHPVKGKIFLYHVEQLRGDEPASRQLTMRQDLSQFLGLPEVLPPMTIWRKPGKNLTQEELDYANSKRLDVCHSNHTEIRNYLMEQARETAEWIMQYFLKSEEVFVSSPEHFEALLKAWEVDPCDTTFRTK